MRLNNPALLWSNVALLMVLVGISVGTRQPLLQQFSVLERQIMSKQSARITEALLQHAERLDAHALAEANWTEMHRYLGMDVPQADPNFFSNNFGESFGQWDYQLLALFDYQDELRHLSILNEQTQKMQDAPIELHERLPQLTELRHFPAEDHVLMANSRRIFFWTNDNQVLLLASRPALKSSGAGPPRGAVVVGGVLDSDFLEGLVRNTTLTAELIPIATGEIAPGSAQGSESIGQIVAVDPEIEIVDDDTLRSRLTLLDGAGRGCFFLQLTAPRLEYQQGRAMLNKLTLILFVLGLTLGAIISFLLQRNFRHRQRLEASEAALHRSNQELHKLVHLDGLTQVANRRRFEAYLDQEWSRALRNQTPLTLILCDIDHFKKFNDSYGHVAGDAVLIDVAGALQRVLKRPSDLLARYGGEEFAVILPETTLEGGRIVAEQLLAQVRELQIPHESAPSSVTLSASLGVACIKPQPAWVSSMLIQRADQNLYLAKDRGRNQVCAQ